MKYILDDEKIADSFTGGQIKHYMKENNATRLESFLYLWAFNNFSVHYPDDLKDCGRPMYRKLAKKLTEILTEEKDNDIHG